MTIINLSYNVFGELSLRERTSVFQRLTVRRRSVSSVNAEVRLLQHSFFT